MYTGPGGPVPDCEEQNKCVEFDMKSDYDYSGNFNGYQVCFWWSGGNGNPQCEKEDSIDHFCYTQGYSKRKIENWSSNSKTCVTINCGETATFGVKDGYGCNSYSGSLTKTITNAYGYQSLIGRCSYKDSYQYPCPGSQEGACTWEIDAPVCTPDPTPKKYPTDYPSSDPTPQPTDPLEPCECYTVTQTDSDFSYNEYTDKNQTCLSYEVTIKPQHINHPTCQDDNIIYVILGTCYENKILEYPKIWSHLSGCKGTPEVVDQNVDGEDIYGIQCKVKFDDPCTLNRDGDCQEDFTICIDRPYGDHDIIQQVGYRDPQATYICQHDGLPDLCQTVDPTIDPTSDPTSDPTRDPTSDPTVDPTYKPTVFPTTDPTDWPTMLPSYDPTKEPTVHPTQERCDAIENKEIMLDAFFIVDRSCSGIDNDGNYCQLKQDLIAELMASLKNKDNGNGQNIRVRIGYIEFGQVGMDIVINLDDNMFNSGPITGRDITDYYAFIKNRDCAPNDEQVSTYRDLEDAIQTAIDALDSQNTNRNRARNPSNNFEKKIIVFSDCEQDIGDGGKDDDFCDKKDDIQGMNDPNDGRTGDIDVIFVNLGNGNNISPDYGLCLAKPGNVINKPIIPYGPNPEGTITGPEQVTETVPEINEEICETPTTSPTSFVFIFFPKRSKPTLCVHVTLC